MAYKTQLTGAVRYRAQTRFFRSPLLVLQVEERSYGTFTGSDGEESPKFDTTYWRDAKTEDITGRAKRGCDGL